MIKKIKSSLILKTSLLFTLAAIIPYLLATVLFFNSSKKALYEEIVKGMQTKIGLTRDTLDTRLFLLRGNAIAWAGLEVMKDTLTDDIDKRISSVLEGLKRDYGLSGEIHVINKEGVIVSSTEKTLTGKKIDFPWLSRALSGEAIDIDVHESESTGAPVISFGIPIKPSIIGTGIVGVVLVDYNIKDMEDILHSSDVSYGAIFSRDGDIVVALRDGPFKEPDFMEKLHGSSNGAIFISSPGYIVAIAASKGFLDFKGFGWKVALAVKQEEALFPVRRIERVSTAVGLMGMLLILGLVSFFAARTVRPLKILSNAAADIAKTKNFSKKAMSLGNDEIGVLANAFNHMVEEAKTHIYNLQRANIELLEVLGSAIAKRDSDTNTHNYRVTIISIRLAERLGRDRDGIKALIKGSFLHDVGKIGISDNILVKPGKLTGEEYEIMKGHVRHGVDIIQSYNWLRDAIDVVLNHHEKYDGRGYPAGKKGEDIPINARIFAVADVFDALTSNRPYRGPLSYEEAMEILEPERGEYFDPEIFDIFKVVSKEIYTEVTVADEKVIKSNLNNLISKYFTSEGEEQGS